MGFPADQIAELKPFCQELAVAEEGGQTYFLLRGLRLPQGCSPASCDALFRPTPGDGYNARLFFDRRVQGKFERNWNGQIHILDRNWVAFSWQQPTEGLRLAQIVTRILEGFLREK